MTLTLLNQKRQRIEEELRPCMGPYDCKDQPRAMDVLRTYVCAIYDCLTTAYGSKMAISQWEKDIAEEAVRITATCWKKYNFSPHHTFLIEPLTQAIVLHVGHPLRSGQAVQQTMPVPQAYAAAGINTDNPAPLLKMAMAAPITSRLIEPDTIATKLKALKKAAHLSAQKIADGIKVDVRTVQRHLSGEAEPRDSQIAAYEEFFTKKLGKTIQLP